jgi:hypothetical protein
MILEGEFLLPILDCQTDLVTVCVDNGFRGIQEGSAQDDGCPYISTCFQNHEVYEYV